VSTLTGANVTCITASTKDATVTFFFTCGDITQYNALVRNWINSASAQNSLGVKGMAAEESATEPKKNMLPIIIGAAAGGVVALALIALVIVKLAKGKSTTAARYDEDYISMQDYRPPTV
jgi:cytochrome b involved in lipid metabolism